MTLGWTRRQFLHAGALGTGALVLAACSSETPLQNLAYHRDLIPYGPAPMQGGELLVASLPTPRPVAVLIHGGYWRDQFDRSEMNPFAEELARAGFAAWNIDYRRVGDGGGWQNTFDDVAAGIDKLAELAPQHNLDLGRVAVIGHSAGAQLALWAASRRSGRAGQPGGTAKVNVKGAVSLSGVLDLTASANATGQDPNAVELRTAVVDLLGGSPAQVPDRYALASPIGLLPLGVTQLLLHGSKDDRVPVDQSRAYVAAAAKAGDATKLIELPNVDHFEVLKTTKLWWDEILAWLRLNVQA
jgi:acetyl esterase/lipase